MIPSVDTMQVWSHDELMMSCPLDDCKWVCNLGHRPTTGDITKAAIGHRFEHLMTEGGPIRGTGR